MKIEIKEIYKCEYCNKLYQIKHYCIQHEKYCYHNKDNDRLCLGCLYLIKKNTVIYLDSYDRSEQKRPVELFYCGKIDSFLYPPITEVKKNMFETDPDTNLSMKTECEYFKNIR